MQNNHKNLDAFAEVRLDTAAGGMQVGAWRLRIRGARYLTAQISL